MSNGETIRLQIVNESDKFADLRQEWNNLLIHTKTPSIFSSWEWNYHWWNVFQEKGMTLWIMLIREGSLLIGLAPFYCLTRKLSGIREVRLLGTKSVGSDHLDVIAEKGRELEVWQAIAQAFVEYESEWDIVRFTNVANDSFGLRHAKDILANELTSKAHGHTRCPYIDLSTDWTTVEETFSPVLRNTIARKKKKWERMRNAEIIVVSGNTEWEAYFNEFLRLNEAGLLRKGIRTPFAEPRYCNFHKAIIKELWRDNGVQLAFLRLNGHYIATLYLFCYSKKYYFYQSGYDNNYAAMSPGTLLFYYVIRKAHSNGMIEFDFLQGREQYKYMWTPRERENMRFNIYRRTPWHRALKMGEEAIGKTRGRIGEIAARVNTYGLALKRRQGC